jgi:hypothetical protein
MMASLPLRLLAASLSFCLLACSSSDGPPTAGSASAGASAARGAMDPEAELDALLRGIADCKLDPKGFVDASCAGALALGSWGSAHKAWLDEDHRAEAAAVGARYVKNPSLPVRLEAWNLVARRVKDDPAMQTLVVETAKTEKDPPALVAIAGAGARAPEVPAIRELLLGLLTHEDETVRKRAVEALVPLDGPPPAAVRPSLLSALKGGSIDVKKKICQRLRVGDDPELLATISKMLDTTSTPATLFDDCFYGLVLSWLGPQVTAPSKAAYERSLACFQKCPRDDAHIGLGVSLMQLVLTPKPDAKKLPEFVDAAQLEKAMIDIIKDDKAQGSLRFATAMNFGDLEVAAKKAGLTPKALAQIGAKPADPAAR